jgi:prepilin-type N-terminal cleavage/methylation domain-containing protein/prepilin-type processing-associated H-X9-DG protein
MRRRPNDGRCPRVAGRLLRELLDLRGQSRFPGTPRNVSSRRAAFSLIELLIVAALLLILTTMYWGSASGSRRRSLQSDCQQNLQKMFIAMQIYSNDHGGKFPDLAAAKSSEEALDMLVPHYTVDTSLFICPASHDAALPSGEPIRNRRISYAYYMGRNIADAAQVLVTDRQVDVLSKAAGQALFSATGKPPGNNHQKDGGNLLYCDGHVETSPPRAASALVLTQGVVLLNPKP